MKSSSASSSSSNDSSYFSAIPSPSTIENTHGEQVVPMESSSSSAAVSSSSSSSSSSQPSSLVPSSSTRQNTHHGGFISYREEDIRMKSSASVSAASSSSSCSRSSSSQPSSSNPSPSTGEIITTHDVFISFRGEDTRQGFVSHLHSALRRNDIRSYMDDSDLERGNEISSALLRAIEQSRISLIVFSENYSSSRWTLDELVKIMNCRETMGQLVLPIFYRISPSEVGKRRSYSAVFRKHKNLFWSNEKETEQRWTNAMTRAAKLAGWESSKYRTESELLDIIVIEVKRKLESWSHGCEGRLSSQSCSPDEPISGGGLPHVDEHPTPGVSSPSKCLLYGRWDVLWRKHHETLILKTKRPHQPSSPHTSTSYLYRSRYFPKQDQLWWGTQQ